MKHTSKKIRGKIGKDGETKSKGERKKFLNSKGKKVDNRWDRVGGDGIVRDGMERDGIEREGEGEIQRRRFKQEDSNRRKI